MMMDPIENLPAWLHRGVTRPAGPWRCYERAAAYLTVHRDRPGIELVHGLLERVLPGQSVAHAWVELPLDAGPVVFDGARGQFYRRPDYYGTLRPCLVRRYTPDEVDYLVATTGHAGPWDRAFAAGMDAI
jgi:hypothetical protein